MLCRYDGLNYYYLHLKKQKFKKIKFKKATKVQKSNGF